MSIVYEEPLLHIRFVHSLYVMMNNYVLHAEEHVLRGEFWVTTAKKLQTGKKITVINIGLYLAYIFQESDDTATYGIYTQF